jgi:exodeoxyribonuclease-3
MKIASYNVNGLRAAERKGFRDWLKSTQPDIVCLQETKAQPDEMPDYLLDLGYHGYYHSAVKKGYSGVGILSKIEPKSVVFGMGVDWIDAEGRVIRADFDGFSVFSLYFPSGTTGDVRQDVKYRFLNEFLPFSKSFSESDKPVILCGDFNIAHRPIDIHDPVGNKNSSGFLPEERAWMDALLASGWNDVFRTTVGETPHLYSWWTYRAGAKGNNKGWRIDYHATNNALKTPVKRAFIERELDMSDHAPVTIEYSL